jgi:hypothetical protein
VNITDCYVGVNLCYLKFNNADYESEPPRAILPPRFTQRVVVRRTLKEKEVMHRKDRFFVCNMIVAEGFQSSNVKGYITLKDSKQLPLTFKKVSSLTKQSIVYTLTYS